MNEPLTIVLPMHNAERRLKAMVEGILEVATPTMREVRIAIVDDGSTDDTFEAACSLANVYPQISVLRQPFQRGIGPALERVQRLLGATQALVHDGSSALDLGELDRQLKAACQANQGDSLESGRGSRRFASLAALHSQLNDAHRWVASFRWLSLEVPSPARRSLRHLTSMPDMVSAVPRSALS